MNIRSAALACMGIAVLATPAAESAVEEGRPLDEAIRDVIPVRDPGKVVPAVEEGSPLYEAIGDVIPVKDAGAVVARLRISPDPGFLDALIQVAEGKIGSLELGLPLFSFRGQDQEAELRTTASVVVDSGELAGDGRYLLSGHSTSRPGDLVVLVVSADTLDGRLTIDDRNYLIRNVGSDHFLLLLNPELLPLSAPPIDPKPSASPGTQHNPPHPHPDVKCNPEADKEISVLVLYTEEARLGAAKAASGGASSLDPAAADKIMRSDALSALGAANAALKHSGVTKTRFGILLNAELVQYVETHNGDRALHDLYSAGHSLHTAARQLRERPGMEANLVTLVIEHWPEACGVAPVMIDWDTHPDQTAYSVVRRDCLEGDHYSLAHELGHSMGSAHDRENAGLHGLFTFSYGYNATDTALSTVMAYPCPGCKRQKLYSNPYSTALGAAVQSGQFDNAQSIKRAACRVVNWK